VTSFCLQAQRQAARKRMLEQLVAHAALGMVQQQ
jgi:hypothetical protein